MCYADNTLVVVGREGTGCRKGELRGGQDDKRNKKIGLELAPRKTEALFFHKRSRGTPPATDIVLDGVPVRMG